jgi:RNA 2',3'-cyclic 3'-phosphodiesterase
MRLFVSIIPPAEILQELVRLQKILPPFSGTHVKSENLHCTLAFLGSVEDSDLPAIITTFSTISYPSFPLRLSSLGLNSPRKPHVIWAALDAPLAVPLALKLSTLFNLTEKRAFSGHITLARIKKSDKSIAQDLAQIEVAPLTWQATQLYLQASDTLPEGPVYSTIATVDLHY